MSFFEELRRRNVFRVGIAYGVTAWLLIQVSDTVFPRIGLSESAVTLVIALLAVGFVPAVMFAWAFELTPEGIRRERDVERAESITPQTGKKLDRVIMGVLAAVVVWLLFDDYYLEPREQAALPGAQVAAEADANLPASPEATRPDTAEKSIAVLPFVNMSADAENEYFSDGIAEELLNVLVRISALEVASRTSSFAYKGKELPLSQIAGELGVNHILEGSVRKAGNRVRITAQLIDANSDRHLWSDSYERELDDIFDIQEEISNHIVSALKIALDVDEAADMARLQRPTDNPEAYELYLQGRFQWRKRQEANIRSAIALLETAIELDPAFAKAHEALASAWTVLPSWSNADPKASIERAVRHADDALKLDPGLAEARAIRAHYAAFSKHWTEALTEFESALEAEPRNAGVRQWYAEALADSGYLRAALKEIEQAYHLDPAAPVINSVYTQIAAIAGEDELAIRHMNKAQELGLATAVVHAIPTLVRTGDWATIERLVYPVLERLNLPLRKSCIEAFRDPALYEVIRHEIARLESGNEPNQGLYAYCSAMVGELDRAFPALARHLQEDPTNIGPVWNLLPGGTEIRRDPRFRQILEDIGLLELYAVRGWPDRCRPAGTEDFVCD